MSATQYFDIRFEFLAILDILHFNCSCIIPLLIVLFEVYLINTLLLFARALLSSFIPNPIQLASINCCKDPSSVVADAQLSALRRALHLRIPKECLVGHTDYSDTKVSRGSGFDCSTLCAITCAEVPIVYSKSYMMWKNDYETRRKESTTVEGDKSMRDFHCDVNSNQDTIELVDPANKRTKLEEKGKNYTYAVDTLTAAVPKARREKKKCIPCGNNINWIIDVENKHYKNVDNNCFSSEKKRRLVHCKGGTMEVTIAQTGALQGAIKKNIGTISASSRLCRRQVFIFFRKLFLHRRSLLDQNRKSLDPSIAAERTLTVGNYINDIEDSKTKDNKVDVDILSGSQSYAEYKQRVSSDIFKHQSATFFSKEPFCQWLRSDSSSGSNMMTLD